MTLIGTALRSVRAQPYSRWKRSNSASRRSAEILGEIVGYGAATDAHHLTQPHPEGDAAFATMTAACRRAKVNPAQVGLRERAWHGHAVNDSSEAAAINRWAGNHAASLFVSSTKSSIGHLLGGAGAVEAAICLMGLARTMAATDRDLPQSGSCLCVFRSSSTNGSKIRATPCPTHLALAARTRHSILTEVAVSDIFVCGCGVVSPAGWGIKLSEQP